MQEIRIRPQSEPQRRFLASPADIAIYGGAAGAGKTWAIVVDPLRYIEHSGFAAVIFRRTTPQIRRPGGLWDEARKLYKPLGAHMVKQSLDCIFPKGSRITMAHLEHDESVQDWGGAAVPYIGWDELQLFTRQQFFFMLSRNRSTTGIQPMIRGTCNPDPDSWLAEFLAWWINQATGFPIPERSGALRWFIRRGDELIWGDTKDELLRLHGYDEQPMSVTFVPGTINDNQILLQSNPRYLANLRALNRVDRARLLEGNWKIRATAGTLFKSTWCQTVDMVPAGLDTVRYWDLAATEKTPENDPDWTIGVKLAREPVGSGYRYYLMDVKRERLGPRGVRSLIKNTAQADGVSVRIGIPQDPGQAGKAQSQDIITEMAGYDVRASIETGDKVLRFGPVSAQAEAGNVLLLRGLSSQHLTELEGFPDGNHMDDADALAGAMRMFTANEAYGLAYLRQLAAQQKAS